MSSLMVDFIASLDGFGAADNWPGLWGMESPEYLSFLEEDDKTEYTSLMGANTYRLMSDIAERAGDDPGLAALTATPKVVFSSTLEEPLSWDNTDLVSSDAVDWVKEKKDDGSTLRTLGSVSLCRSLIEAGQVDRIRVVVFPVITGASGKEPVFSSYPDVKLELVEQRTFEGGLQLLEYIPTVLDEPPGA